MLFLGVNELKSDNESVLKLSGIYQCSYCEKSYERRNSLARHERKKHEFDRPNCKAKKKSKTKKIDENRNIFKMGKALARIVCDDNNSTDEFTEDHQVTEKTSRKITHNNNNKQVHNCKMIIDSKHLMKIFVWQLSFRSHHGAQ